MGIDPIKRAVLAAMLAAALIGAGCGGDDDGLSQEEFIAEADAICVATDEQLDAAGDQEWGEDTPSPDQLIEFLTDRTLPAIAEQTEEIRALDAPDGDEDEVAAMLDAAEQGVAEGTEDPELFLTGGPAGLAEFSRLAEEYGLERCGQ